MGANGSTHMLLALDIAADLHNDPTASWIGDTLMPQLAALTAVEQPKMCESSSDPVWNAICGHWQSVIDSGVIENGKNICCDHIPVACRSDTTCSENSSTCFRPTCMDEENYLSSYEALMTHAFMDHNLSLTEERRCIFATAASCVPSNFVENVVKKRQWLDTTDFVDAATQISQELDSVGQLMEQQHNDAKSTSLARMRRVARGVTADGFIEISGVPGGSAHANPLAFVRSKGKQKHGEIQANGDIQISADYGDEKHGLRQVQNHEVANAATRSVAGDGVVEVSGGFGDSTRVNSPIIARNAAKQK